MQRPCRERARRAQAREHAFRGGQPRAARARIGIPDSEDSADSADSGMYMRDLTGVHAQPELCEVLPEFCCNRVE